MKGLMLGLSLSVAFVVGCVSAPLVVPPLTAQSPSTQRWEYFCFDEWGAADVTAKSNEVGREGWEMVAYGAHENRLSWCFKRPL